MLIFIHLNWIWRKILCCWHVTNDKLGPGLLQWLAAAWVTSSSHWRLSPETETDEKHTENLSHTEPLAQERDLRITLTFLQPLLHQYLIMISLCTNRRTAAQCFSLSTCADSVTHTQELGALHTTNILPTYRQMLNLSPTQYRFLCGFRKASYQMYNNKLWQNCQAMKCLFLLPFKMRTWMIHTQPQKS